MQNLNSLSSNKDGKDLDAASKMYFALLERMVEQDVADFRSGRVDQNRLNWTLDAIKSVMNTTEDKLALNRLQELYDRAVISLE